MKQRTLWLATLLMTLNISFGSDEAISAAETAVESWISMTDTGDFGSSWTHASSLFQAAITQSDWEKALTAVRRPLGGLKSRGLESSEYFTTLPGAPDGEYVVLKFNTSFDNKEAAVETVTAMLDQDGSWRVSGYFIR